jgi:hypothetical protein
MISWKRHFLKEAKEPWVLEKSTPWGRPQNNEFLENELPKGG